MILLVGGAVAIALAASIVAWFRFAPYRPVQAQVSTADAARDTARAERTEDRPAEPSSPPADLAPPSSPLPSSPPPSSPAPSPLVSKASPKPSTRSSRPAPPPGRGAVVDTTTCEASFYTDDGGLTASGEIFRVNEFTAANKTLPFNTRVRVTNLANGRSTVVRINDRGPFVAGRCIDLSPIAFRAIARESAGVANVRVDVLS
jgi:rare lipoprotein A